MCLRRFSNLELGRAAMMWDAEQIEVLGQDNVRYRDEDVVPLFRDIVIGAADSLWVIADCSNTVIALLVLKRHHIAHLYVDRSSRRRGCGRRLIEHAKGQFPEGLSVHTVLRVAPFYVRHGFVQVAVSECGTEVDLEWRP